MMRFALLLLALELAAADTSALDAIEFYPSSGPLLATESWGPAVIAVASLNDGLWAAANTNPLIWTSRSTVADSLSHADTAARWAQATHRKRRPDQGAALSVKA